MNSISIENIKDPNPKKVKDVWNAFMAEGAVFGNYDIPYCPTTAITIPRRIITWDEAKAIFKKQIKIDNHFKDDTFVCFYMDDYKFDGARGIWYDPYKVLTILCHFGGVITPDFSTYQDFPVALKICATFRMRLWGYWLGRMGISVINNVRWGTPESYDYSFEGIPENSIVAIGTVGGSPRQLVNRERFIEGLYEMVKRLKPHTILIFGSDKYECFDVLRQQGINVIQYPSNTASYYERRGPHE